MRYLLELGLCLGHFECGCVEFGGRVLVRVRSVDVRE